MIAKKISENNSPLVKKKLIKNERIPLLHENPLSSYNQH